MSEIDDIFTSKGKAKAVPSLDPSLPVSKKKKKDKKKKPTADVTPAALPPAIKRPLPETVVDPSSVPAPKKRHRVDNDLPARAKRPKTKKNSKEEEQFKDSRGTGPRRKTEEGWSIYKEAELGLTAEGGDTPLCPFDCDCCECDSMILTSRHVHMVAIGF
ncbi:hypothetical protein AN958_04892 [Leucoagaricus sp. SymC.cos]|nr:hypothetical protein AN958_04892 [Leucoagaricus sp. SymC.cos]